MPEDIGITVTNLSALGWCKCPRCWHYEPQLWVLTKCVRWPDLVGYKVCARCIGVMEDSWATWTSFTTGYV